MENNFICDICHAERPMSDCHIFEEQRLCADCLDEETVDCQDCGKRIRLDDNAGNMAYPLCQTCYDARYATCHRCGDLIHRDRAHYRPSDEYAEYPYCNDCFAAINAGGIRDYYYKPAPIFYGEGPRYFGVELEIDDGGEDTHNADEIQEAGNAFTECIYCKHDGSLDQGFEIVTHPMSIQYHMKEMPWKDILRTAVCLGYVSHQAETCGLHIHVSRKAFGDYSWEQDDVVSRILYFVEKNWEELLKFSRRTPGQLKQWAARYGYKDHPRDILDHAKEGRSGRYSCVNLRNTDTIEFRIFRGTLKYNTLIATLQLVNRICDVAISSSNAEIKALSWTSFVADCTEPELIQYLKERRLFVNDPVVVEEEV